MATTCPTHDVLLVCSSGHVITDRLQTCPEQGFGHCPRCGADTLSQCPTCGHELPGAMLSLGPVPIGTSRPPQYCALCGAAFPWAPRPQPPDSVSLDLFESLLRRLPRVARALRYRQDEQPPFHVEDVHDLEDLLRALLPIHFDDAVAESRTPSYTPRRRTDYLLHSGTVSITAKYAGRGFDERQLARELLEDVAYYQRRAGCTTVVCFVYDPEGFLAEPGRLEAVWSRPHDNLRVRCVIA